MSGKRSIIWKLSSAAFVKLYHESESMAAMLRTIGLAPLGGQYRTIQKRMKVEGLSIQEIKDRAQKANVRRLAAIPSRKMSLDRLLVQGVKRNNSKVKKRLVEAGLVIAQCAECGQGTTWKGKSLSLHLDHINGDRLDYRLENLRLLCPNCHSQTSTYCVKNVDAYKNRYICSECGKGITKDSKSGLCHPCFSKTRRKVERPSRNVLLEQIDRLGYCGTARLYDVSDNAIRKWLK